ncbi:MAG TPA: hypothetical protein VGC04_06940 [Cellulomonas sp.]
MNRRVAAAAGVLLVGLALGGCGRLAERLDHGAGAPASQGATAAPGASAATTSPAPETTREDGPTPAAWLPAAADVLELQQALGAANGLADQVDQDIASDGS